MRKQERDLFEGLNSDHNRDFVLAIVCKAATLAVAVGGAIWSRGVEHQWSQYSQFSGSYRVNLLST